jgi:membrane protein YdbS with pleckstrin-like domain
MDPSAIYRLERPHPSLLTLYVLRSILSGPFFFIALPMFLFRYHTLRYRFDDEGVHMQWGLLFRREVNLTYARIQDIHLRSGFIQRWLGLADLLVQTASGSAEPELTIEGFHEYEAIRDFLYTRMRGFQRGLPAPPGIAKPAAAVSASTGGVGGGDVVGLLCEIRDELRGARVELERRGRGPA